MHLWILGQLSVSQLVIDREAFVRGKLRVTDIHIGIPIALRERFQKSRVYRSLLSLIQTVLVAGIPSLNVENSPPRCLLNNGIGSDRLNFCCLFPKDAISFLHKFVLKLQRICNLFLCVRWFSDG